MDAQRHPEEMQPTNIEAAVAVMAVEMRYIRSGIDDLKVGQASVVSRNEWEQRNGYVDQHFISLEKEMSARRVPWTSVGSLVIAGAALLLVVIESFGAATP